MILVNFRNLKKYICLFLQCFIENIDQKVLNEEKKERLKRKVLGGNYIPVWAPTTHWVFLIQSHGGNYFLVSHLPCLSVYFSHGTGYKVWKEGK